MPQRSEIIQLQNDLFRLGDPSVPGKYVLTQGIIGLLARDQIPLREIALLVAQFNLFTEDNDPQGEHDFGMFDFHGERCMWKIDYYDLAYHMGSEDPTDLTQTLRVLTILLASEY